MAGNGFFETFNQDMLGALNTASTANSSIYLQIVSTLVTGAITLYVIWMGYQTLAGKVQSPVPDMLWSLARFAILLAFINDTDTYMSMVNSAIKEMKEGLSGPSIQNVWSELDQLFVIIQALAEKLYIMDPNQIPLSGWTARGLVWLGGMVLMMAVALVIFIADAMLVLLFVTAPIFVFCLMFGFLRGMFNNWLQLVFSSVLTLMFASLVGSVSISFMNTIVSQISQQAPNANLMAMGAIVLMTGGLTAALVFLARYCASYVASLGVTGAVQGLSLAGLSLPVGSSAANRRLVVEPTHELRSFNHVIETSQAESSTSAYLASTRMSQQAVANMKARHGS